MPTSVQVCRQKLGQSAVGFRQIIAPVRFARAVSGAPVWDAPDPDDRGFALGSDGMWRVTGVRGAVAGVPVSKTVRLKVLREDIDASAPIFVTSDQERAVVTPTTALPADGVFRVRVTGPLLVGAKISARLGAANGPVLGEMLIHTMSLASVPLCCHLVTLNGTTVNDTAGAVVPAATGRTQATVQELVRQVNGIWQPAGIYFNVVEWKNTVRTLTQTHGNIAGGYQGCIGTDNSSSWHIQATGLGQAARRAHAINVYFVRGTYNADTGAYNETRGIGTTVMAATSYGVVVVDECDANDLAHELGHVLNLDFHGGGNIGHADDTSAGDHTRDNIWIRRRLLYSYNPYGPLNTTPGRRINVGYGSWVRGSMIAVKNLAGDPTDNEYSEARSRAVSALP
jgi:hypothetical protein